MVTADSRQDGGRGARVARVEVILGALRGGESCGAAGDRDRAKLAVGLGGDKHRDGRRRRRHRRKRVRGAPVSLRKLASRAYTPPGSKAPPRRRRSGRRAVAHARWALSTGLGGGLGRVCRTWLGSENVADGMERPAIPCVRLGKRSVAEIGTDIVAASRQKEPSRRDDRDVAASWRYDTRGVQRPGDCIRGGAVVRRRAAAW